MIKSELLRSLEEGLEHIKSSDSAPLTYPKTSEWGDYATGVAKVAATKSGKPFDEVAAVLQKHITDTVDAVERVDIVNNTYLNIHLKRHFFVDQVRSAVEKKEVWGNNDDEAGKIAVIEHTSPNLFKPLHIGNLVGNVVGESLVRLFGMSGATVQRVIFPSDVGPNIAKGVWGLRKTGADTSDIRALGEAYVVANEAYESDSAAKEEMDEVNRSIYQGSDAALIDLWKQGRETSLNSLNNLCAMLGTAFDTIIFESEAGPIGKEAAEKMVGNGVLEHSDGAVFFRGEGKGPDGKNLNDSVVVTGEGYPTYTAKDIGNFLKKNELFPEWSTSLVVTGSEQVGHFEVVHRIVHELMSDRQQEHVVTGFLTLKSEGSSRGEKMSSRKGNVLTAENLIQIVEDATKEKMQGRDVSNPEEVSLQIAVGAIKYQISSAASR